MRARLARVLGLGDVEACTPQAERDHLPNWTLVLNDQDLAIAHGALERQVEGL